MRWIPSRSAAKTQIGRNTTSRWTYSPVATGGFSDGSACARAAWPSRASNSDTTTSATACTSSTASSDSSRVTRPCLR